MLVVLLIALLYCVASAEQRRKGVEFCNSRRPVFIVNGMMGSMMDADISIPEKYSLRDGCSRHLSAYSLWLSPDIVIPSTQRCIPEYMTMRYNKKTGRMENREGVSTYYPYGWSVEGVSHLTSVKYLRELTRVFVEITDNLEMMGYYDPYDLQAAAIDWRLMKQSDKWKADLQMRIEQQVKGCGRKAVIVAHSLGGLVAFDFLESMKQSWIDKNVYKVITISTPWAGTLKALRGLLSGDRLGLPSVIFDEELFLNASRTFESLYGLLPNPDLFGMKEILKVGNNTYTAKGVHKLIKVLSGSMLPDYAKELAKMSELSLKWKNKFPHTCVYSEGVETETHLTYSPNYTLVNSMMTADGDGTVEVKSLSLCKNWASEVVKVSNVEHLRILENKEVISLIQSEVCAEEDYEPVPMTLLESILMSIQRLFLSIWSLIY